MGTSSPIMGPLGHTGTVGALGPLISISPGIRLGHCCNESIFLPVPVPVLELTQIIWRFRDRF